MTTYAGSRKGVRGEVCAGRGTAGSRPRRAATSCSASGPPSFSARAIRQAYARDVVAADFEEAGHEDVVRKVRADFDAAGIVQTEDQIRLKMLELLSEAITQIQNS